ncbi:hypothetical protein [Thalassotalea sp. PS06]|uniref:hypothetical protein n=1 Tax=Thalassotalea sp. PS06 TaxID=2594005 RepID=UPI001165615F|nr:hypothetical protein [Thalassotalea sp. PS06]QDP00396.1 hypothetical protein FNC98_02930 [Thalassotalea sp. PS06]
MKYLKFLSLAPLLMLTTACLSTTTPEVSMGKTRFQSPEVNSKPFDVKVNMSTATRSVVVLSDLQSDILSRGEGPDENGNCFSPCFRPTADVNDNDGEADLRIEGSVSVGKGFEVIVSGGDSNKISLKYQFYGAHEDQSGTGNVSQAIAIGYESFEDSNSGVNWKTETKTYDIAYIIGRRLSKRTIVYGGPFVQIADAQGDGYLSFREQPDYLFSYGVDGHMLGANLAIEQRFSSGLGWGVEGVVSKSDWGDDDYTDGAVHLRFGYQF